jgi:general secretion pathway protein I
MKGMTLLEVLVALVVFATASMSVLGSVSQHINNVGYLEKKVFALVVADNTLARLQLEGKLSARSQQGKTELAGQTWYWKLSPKAITNGYLQALELKVFADKDRQSSLAELKTYVAK